MNRNKILLNAALGITALSLIGGCSPKKVQQVTKVIPVEIYLAKPDSISSFVKLHGGIEAQSDAFVYSKVSEKLISLNVKPGDIVRAGQIIGAQYNEGTRQGKKVSEAALRSAQIQLENAKMDFDRMKNLLEKKAVTQQQFDQAKSKFNIAEATIEQATASVEQVNVQFNNALLQAPFDGQVAMIYYDINEMIPAGQPVVKIVNAKTVKAELNVPEVDISKISAGQQVKAVFPSIPDKEFSGTVYRIDGAVNPATRTLEIDVRIPNVDNLLKSGISGEFRIETKHHSNTVVVSEMTIMTRTQISTDERGIQTAIPENYVYGVKNNKAIKKIVNVGISFDGMVEIINGIQFGDSIIVSGQNTVKDGDTLRIITTAE